MVVGNGLIAKAFNFYRDREDIIIFASGVSNSSISQDKDEFDREINLLKDSLKYGKKKLIYFSTCSIVDGSAKTPYIQHKIGMENLIKSNSNNFLIFRLPIVLGLSNNNNTFFNAISNKILKNETIVVQKNISRYLIDIDDLSNILPFFIEDYSNMIVNVCFENRELVEKMISIMEKYLGNIPQKKYKDMASNLPIDNAFFLERLKFIGEHYNIDYNEKIIKKYCKLIIDMSNDRS